MAEKTTPCTFRVSVLYRDYLERGQEFKPGLGIGLFAAQEYTYNLPRDQYKRPLFQAHLLDKQQELLNELFEVRTTMVEKDGKPVPSAEEETPHTATAKLFQRYLQVCETAIKSGAVDRREGDPEDTGLQHLANLCTVALAPQGAYPIDKLSRWLGFVQAVLTMRGLVTVQGERDFSRPLFHAAYRTIGFPIPETENVGQVGQDKAA